MHERSAPQPGSTEPFVLDANADDVLPPATERHGASTSCMIVSTEAAGGTYEAYVYSKVDGWKSG